MIEEIPDEVRRKGKTFIQKWHLKDNSFDKRDFPEQKVCWKCGKRKYEVKTEENVDMKAEVRQYTPSDKETYIATVEEGETTFSFRKTKDGWEFFEWYPPEHRSSEWNAREQTVVLTTTLEFEFLQKIVKVNSDFPEAEHHLIYGEDTRDKEFTIAICTPCHKGYDARSDRRKFENLRSKPYFESYGDEE